MQAGANVKNIEAIEQLRASVCVFGDEVQGALAIVQAELGRFLDWLEHDRLPHWQREVRRREEQLAEAKNDLHRAISATIDPRHTPSCHQEKKMVEVAKGRLAEAEQKLTNVRRWIPIVRQAVFEYKLKSDPLTSAIASDLPRAASFLRAAVARLNEYLDVAPPPGEVATKGTKETFSQTTRPTGAASSESPASRQSPEPAPEADEPELPATETRGTP
jgi:hypothetical protein